MSTARDEFPALRAATEMFPDRAIGVEAESALDAIDRLRRWKAEAMQVLAGWDAVWEAAGYPGRPGQYRSEAVREQIDRLRAEVDR